MSDIWARPDAVGESLHQRSRLGAVGRKDLLTDTDGPIKSIGYTCPKGSAGAVAAVQRDHAQLPGASIHAPLLFELSSRFRL